MSSIHNVLLWATHHNVINLSLITKTVDLDVRNRNLGIPSRAQQSVARAFCVQFVEISEGAVWSRVCVCFQCRLLKVVRVCVLGRFLFEVLDCVVTLCVSGAVRRDFDVCDVAACVFVAQSSEICAHAVSLRVRRFRALVAAPFLSFESCPCAVHVCAVSCELCVCSVFCVRWIDVCGALGMSVSVESWSWQYPCVCACVSDLVFVLGRCPRWMFVVASAKCSACQSVFFFQFAMIVRCPLTLRAVPRAATLSC